MIIRAESEAARQTGGYTAGESAQLQHSMMANDGGSSGVRSNGGGPSAPDGNSAVPDKLYFRIGEVAALCRVPTYVLRFWQTEFAQLRPGKSGTGQRLYRKRDVETALRIKRLLHEQGYTIAGAKAVLAGEAAVPLRLQPELAPPSAADEKLQETRAQLTLVRSELRELLALLERGSLGPVPAGETNREPE